MHKSGWQAVLPLSQNIDPCQGDALWDFGLCEQPLYVYPALKRFVG
jgi:hypothetical protein